MRSRRHPQLLLLTWRICARFDLSAPRMTLGGAPRCCARAQPLHAASHQCMGSACPGPETPPSSCMGHEGLRVIMCRYVRDWKSIEAHIGTKTAIQVSALHVNGHESALMRSSSFAACCVLRP